MVPAFDPGPRGALVQREPFLADRTTAGGALGDTPLKDLPYSASVITRDLLNAADSRTVMGALTLDPSVGLIRNSLNEAAQPTIRGFGQADTDSGNNRINGGPGFLSRSEIPLELVERIEILKGAAAFGYGFVAPGGIINYVFKKPLQTPGVHGEVKVGYASDSIWTESADVSARSQDGRVGVRFIGANEKGTATYMGVKVDRQTVGGSADIRITDNLLLELDAFGSQRQINRHAFAFNVGTANQFIPRPTDFSKQLFPDFIGYNERLDSQGAKLTWDIAPGWFATTGFRRNYQRVNFSDAFSPLADNGDYPIFQAKFGRDRLAYGSQNTIDGKFVTGSIQHHVIAGFDYRDESQFNALGTNGQFFQVGLVGNANLYQPLPNFADPGLEQPSFSRGFTSVLLNERSGYVSDKIDWTSWLSTLAGVRYVSFDQRQFDAPNVAGASFNRDKASPTVAVMVKPIAPLMLYASYAEALEVGGVAPFNAVNANAILAPKDTKQYEIGAKYDFTTFLVQTALFRIEKPAEFLTAGNVFIQQGTQTHDGAEITVAGKIAPFWSAFGGVQYLIPKVETPGGAIPEFRPPGVSKVQITMFVEHDLAAYGLYGLAANGGVRYVSTALADSLNRLPVGEYALFDIGVRYKIPRFAGGPDLTLRAGVENLGNKQYWVAGDGYVLPGAPRTFKASVSAKF